MNEVQILVLDFGSQYTQLIARRLRERGVYTEIAPYFESIDSIKAKNPKGIILSGGPASVYEEGAYKPADGIFNLGIPILGICYGMQYIAHFFGGKVIRAQEQEFGKAHIEIPRSYGFVPSDNKDRILAQWREGFNSAHAFLGQKQLADIYNTLLDRAVNAENFYVKSNPCAQSFGFYNIKDSICAFECYLIDRDLAYLDVLQEFLTILIKRGIARFITQWDKHDKKGVKTFLDLGFKKGETRGVMLELFLDNTDCLQHILLTTKYGILKEARSGDLALLSDIFNDKNAIRSSDMDNINDKESIERFLNEQEDSYKKYGYGIWILTDKDSGALLACMGFKRHDGFLELRYIIRREAQERAERILHFCKEYIADKTDCKEIYCALDSNLESNRDILRAQDFELSNDSNEYKDSKEGFALKGSEIYVYKLARLESNLFHNVADNAIVWMSHADKVEQIPSGFSELARSGNTRYCAIADFKRGLYALQFHPEVAHSQYGAQILSNFAIRICNANTDWNMKNFISYEIDKLRRLMDSDSMPDSKSQGRGGKVLCAVSGGVDSSVVATLLHRAIGEDVIPIFVDTGLLRMGEREAVEQMFKENLRVPLITIDASEEFLGLLKGVIDPEKKRKIIGETFIKVFEREAKKHNAAGEIKYLAQGTLYPDVIESVSIKGPSKTIKSHHNVGGLPEWMRFSLIEPLRELFKDEVRALGRELGMPESMLMRHPFPGPGLAIRIMGEVKKQDLEILRKADAIFIQELHNWHLYDSVWQAFCVLLNVKSVGVMGDNRTYDNTICLRAVEALDGMTASFAHLKHEFLEHVSNRIINEVSGINRVVYDITSKPPGTIEWE